MATIVLTSNSHPSSSSSSPPSSSFKPIYLNSWGASQYSGYRDTVDLVLAILRCVIRYSKPGKIRRAAAVGDYRRTMYLLDILCRFGLLIEESITRRNKTKSKRTDRREMRTIRRYYVTPKGHKLIRVYDTMVEHLVYTVS
jgi:predicted transcriptional regulator